jgi:hypothetical protein
LFVPGLSDLSFSTGLFLEETLKSAAAYSGDRDGKDGQNEQCSGPSLTFPSSIMSQLQAQKLRLAYTRSSHYGGSLPNVNQIGCGLAEFQVSGHQAGWSGSS